MKRIITVTQPAESYDLTDLETVKDELGVPLEDETQDARLARYITEASAIISDVCQRVFQVEGLTETIYSPRHHHGGSLYLSRKPVTNILTLPTTAPAMADDTTLTFESVDEVSDAVPVSGSGIAAASIVGDTDGMGNTVTLSLPIGADIPTGTDITFGISASGLVYGVDYKLDLAAGNLFRLYHSHWWMSPFAVSYFAGFDPIPPTVSGTCIRIVGMLNQRRTRDPLERSVSVEGLDAVIYRDWTASDMRDFIASELSAYMPPPAFA